MYRPTNYQELPYGIFSSQLQKVVAMLTVHSPVIESPTLYRDCALAMWWHIYYAAQYKDMHFLHSLIKLPIDITADTERNVDYVKLVCYTVYNPTASEINSRSNMVA